MDAATVKQLVTVLGDPSMYDEDGIMHITQDAMRKVLVLIVSLQSELTCAELGRKWIPLSESLPPDNRQNVLMSNGKEYYYGWRNPDDGLHFVDELLQSRLQERKENPYHISHWMPLPDLPKAGDPE